MEWARTFAGALPCSELLLEYGIKGPLDEDKLNLLREERLALVLAAEVNIHCVNYCLDRRKWNTLDRLWVWGNSDQVRYCRYDSGIFGWGGSSWP